MKKLLRIDVSARYENSISRMIGDYFEQKWKSVNPNGQIVSRDLAENTIPHITSDVIDAFYTEKANHTSQMLKAIRLSDELINEINLVDEIFIGSPLYNFNVPSVLKAYFDHVVRINETFGIDDQGAFYGMLKNKKAYVTTVKGAVYNHTDIANLDMQDPYLKLILPFLGISIADFISIEGTSTDELVLKQTKDAALQRIDEIVK